MSQQSKNLITVAALVVVAGAVGLYAYYGVMKPDEKEKTTKETNEKFLPVALAADAGSPTFQKLTLNAKGDTTTVVRGADGKWKLTAPFDGAADQDTVNALTRELESGKFKEVAEEKPTDEDLQRYGLKTPSFTVSAVAKLPGGDEKTVELEGGIENPWDGSVYLRRKGDATVYSAQGSSRMALEKSLYDLRDKVLAQVDEAKVTRMDVKRKESPFAVSKDPSGTWQLEGSAKGPADSSTVSGMISGFKSERVTQFLKDSPEERKKDGVENPKLDVTFISEGAEPVVRLRLAEVTEASGGKKTYALREVGPKAELLEVSSSALGVADKKLDELKDKTVLAVKQEQVAELKFAPGDGKPELDVKKASADGSGEDWVVSPEKKPAKKYKLSSLVWGIANLKATALDKEAPADWSKFGITEKSQKVTALDKEGKVLGTLVIGKEVPGKTDNVYARGSRNQVMQVEKSRFSDWPKAMDDLLEPPPAANSDGGTASPL